MGPGQTLFDFVRHWSRRGTRDDPSIGRGRLVLVTEAADALVRRDARATITAIAREIGFDQSGASRLVTSAEEAGYLVLTPDATDRRRREVTLTSAGRRLVDQAHRWQEQVFDQLSEGWSDRRRQEFQRALTDLIDRSYALDD